MSPILISVEGNIGAGKTTFIEHVQTLLETSGNTKIRVLREPVDIWTKVKDESGVSILENFYKDSKRWAFAFQMLALSTRMSEIQKAITEYNDCDIILCERSIECDGYVFAKMLYDDGLIDTLSYNIYRTMYESFISQFAAQHVVYLAVGPETCKERIGIRGRTGEDGISIDYLKKCHDYHANWLTPEPTNTVEAKHTVCVVEDAMVREFYDSAVDAKISMLTSILRL